MDSKAQVLVSCRLQGSIEDVFRTLWASDALSISIHKSRGDAKFVETPWLPSKESLPSWTDAPLADRANTPDIEKNRYRKIRFESAPSALATLPFVNEELHHCTVYEPRRRIVETEATTSAPMGDK